MKFKTRRKRTPPYFSREPELLDLILPGDVLAFFEVVKESTTSDQIDIYLDEKNIPPREYGGQGVLSKGFTGTTRIQDFPLRGRSVYLHVRRREFALPWRVVHDRHEQGRSRWQGYPGCHHRGGKGRGSIQDIEETSPASPSPGDGDHA